MSRLQQGGAVQGHADISRCSIDAMSKLRKNIYDLPYLGCESKDITTSSPDPLGLLYSYVYWVQHVLKVERLQKKITFDLHDNGQVHRFLIEHFHHWLEALSLLGNLFAIQ